MTTTLDNNQVHTYEDRYCAFIDILGFTPMVRDEAKWPATRIHQLFSFTEESVQKAFQKINGAGDDFLQEADKTGRSITHFSDSVILSTPANSLYNLTEIIVVVIVTMRRLINEHGVLLRGGIARGKLHHTADHIFGPALIEAHSLEDLAVYPRVILSDMVYAEIQARLAELNALRNNPEDPMAQVLFSNVFMIKQRMVKPDFDGRNFLNYFDKPTKTALKSLIKIHAKADEGIKEKYDWLEAKINKGNFKASKKSLKRLGFGCS